MNVQVRTDKTTEENEIILCEHISIYGKDNDESFPHCEYVETITIHCYACDIDHYVHIAMN